MPTQPKYDSESRELIRRAQAGEADAIAEIYRQHAPKIFRYFFFRLKDQNSAEDLTGEVFLRMVQGLEKYQDYGAPIAAWLFRIARDRLTDYYRQGRRAHAELSEQMVDSETRLESQAIGRLETQHLGRVLETLTDEQQLVIQLRFVDDFNLEETARIMHKTVGAVKALQHRALQSLAERLER